MSKASDFKSILHEIYNPKDEFESIRDTPLAQLVELPPPPMTAAALFQELALSDSIFKKIPFLNSTHEWPPVIIPFKEDEE